MVGQQLFHFDSVGDCFPIGYHTSTDTVVVYWCIDITMLKHLLLKRSNEQILDKFSH